MATAQENVARLREAYRKWHDTRGTNASDWLDLMADDVALRSLGGGSEGLEFGRSRTGKEAAAAYFDDLVRHWEMIYYHTEDFIADADRVVVLSRCAYRYRLTGKVAESPKADVFRFRDGKIVEFFEFFDTAAAAASTRT
jgi:ketosteroid isomerase-like protein